MLTPLVAGSPQPHMAPLDVELRPRADTPAVSSVTAPCGSTDSGASPRDPLTPVPPLGLRSCAQVQTAHPILPLPLRIGLQ
jgi:hypothetical protein